MEESTRTDNYTTDSHTSDSHTSDSTSTDSASATDTSTFNQGPVRRLYRTEGPISGVSGGIADYFGIDASVVRLVIAAGAVLTFPAIPLIYLAAWLIIPEANPAPTQPIMPPTPAPPAPTGNPVPPVPVPYKADAVDTVDA